MRSDLAYEPTRGSGGVFAQRQLLRCSSREHPSKPPPYRSVHDPFKTALGVHSSGPWDPWLPAVENSRLLAPRAQARVVRRGEDCGWSGVDWRGFIPKKVPHGPHRSSRPIGDLVGLRLPSSRSATGALSHSARAARAQRQLLRCSSREHPCKPPPYRSVHDPFKTASGVQSAGPWDPGLPGVDNTRLFAQCGHSARCAP